MRFIRDSIHFFICTKQNFYILYTFFCPLGLHYSQTQRPTGKYISNKYYSALQTNIGEAQSNLFFRIPNRISKIIHLYQQHKGTDHECQNNISVLLIFQFLSEKYLWCESVTNSFNLQSYHILDTIVLLYRRVP